MALGKLPSNYISGNTRQLNLVEDYPEWWTVNLNNIAYGPESITATEHLAVLDTGTSLIVLQESDYERFAQIIYNIGVFDCSGTYCYSYDDTCEYYWDLMEPLQIWLDGQ